MAKGIWERLTDWDRSPVLNCFSYFNERREARINGLVTVLRENYFMLGDAKGDYEKWKLLKDIRDEISYELASFGKHAVPALVKELDDERFGLRFSAVDVLEKINDPCLFPVWAALLKDDEWEIRKNAVRGLWRIGRDALPALMEALDDPHEDVRETAVVALGELGDAGVVPAILEAMEDEDWNVRDSAAVALSKTAELPVVLQHAVRFQAEVFVLPSEVLRGNAYYRLIVILERCGTIEEVESFERKLAEAAAYMRGKYARDEGLVDAMIWVAKVAKEAAEKKDRLAPKRDVLLKDKPKPPMKGSMYRTTRRVMNGAY